MYLNTSGLTGRFKIGLKKYINVKKKKKIVERIQNKGWCVVLPKRKFISVSVHIICSVKAENELWEK